MGRETLQQPVLDAFKLNKNTILSWATGMGKSYMSIQMQKSLGNPKTYVCVAEITHIDNWIEEYKKHGFEYLLSNTTIFCYHSLSKYINTEVDLLILDEIHHLTEARKGYISTIKYGKMIGLSATINFDEFVDLKAFFKGFYFNRVPLLQAIDLNILASPTVYLIALDLDEVNRTETFEIVYGVPTETIEVDYSMYKSYKKKKHIRLIVHCTPAQKYEYLTNMVKYYESVYMQGFKEYNKTKWLRAGLVRKNYLAHLKTDTLKQVVTYLGTKKFICFCGSISQAEMLSPNVLHSKLKGSQQKSILKQFNEGKINSLFLVNKLKEGQNLEGIESGIICQVDNQSRSFVQRLGRVLRNQVDPELFVIYFKNTVDASYLKTALEDLPSENIKFITL